MATEAEIAAEKQLAEEAKVKAEAEAKAKAEAEAEKKPVGEILKEKKEAKLVPEAVLIETKKEVKELKKELADAKKQLEDGVSKKEVSASLKELAEEYELPEEFLQKLIGLTRKEAEAEIEAKMGAELKPLKEKEAREKFDATFKEHFDKSLEALPEYKGVADMELIKTLAKTPEYASKTFEQIFEKLYPNVKTTRKTLDESKPTRGGTRQEIDYAKAKEDSDYFKEIMADPQLKKEYNENLKNRVRL